MPEHINTLSADIDHIRELWRQEPIEPFRELRRRPRGYRNTPEYQEWHTKHKQWEEKVLSQLEEGLAIRKEQNRICITLHHHEIPYTEVVFLPDGIVQCDTPYIPKDEPIPYGWGPNLELPGPTQKQKAFLDHNHRRTSPWIQWQLEHQLDHLERKLQIPNQPMYHSNIRENTDYSSLRDAVIRRATLQWIQAVQERLDPSPMRQIRQWTGLQIKRNIRNHNMAVVSAEVIRETAMTNPGALGWWIRRMESQDDLETRNRWAHSREEGPPPPLTAPPRHPGEIIAAVKTEFQKAGGTQWKALAGQPAKHSASLIAKHEPQQIARFLNQMGKAALPSIPAPCPNTAPVKASATLPGMEPQNPNPDEPRKTLKRLQPPLEIKHLLIDKLTGRTNPAPHGNRTVMLYEERWRAPDNQPEVDRALEKMVMLACREYAGQDLKHKTDRGKREIFSRINNVTDYCRAEPLAAVRATTWAGLEKASIAWHNSAALRAIREDLAKARQQEGPEFIQEWPSPLTFYESENGFIARLLKSPMEMMEETEIMRHCVGSSTYIRECIRGNARIFHIEPKGMPQQDDQLLQAQQKHASTLDLEQTDTGWQIREHQGYRNRDVNDQEALWGKELLEIWLKADKPARKAQPETASPTQ